ncbi:MAG: hypothetical protein UEE32_04755, partial [Oscillospiraceae bacterium]|nr:hypothetical protein [Oscillospiraceae bacterium]
SPFAEIKLYQSSAADINICIIHYFSGNCAVLSEKSHGFFQNFWYDRKVYIRQNTTESKGF